jgi:hypothetical protein
VAGRPPAGATFEVARVGRQRSGGPAAALAFAAILGGLVGIGVLGRGSDAVALAGPSAGASASPVVASAAPSLIDAQPVLDGAPIDLQSPAIGPVTIVTPRLIVRGTVDVRSARVEVDLQTANERTLEQSFVDISSAWEGIRPDQTPSFRAQFDLRAPRPLGTMWIEVTVYDANGRALAFDRRSFIVGPIRGA